MGTAGAAAPCPRGCREEALQPRRVGARTPRLGWGRLGTARYPCCSVRMGSGQHPHTPALVGPPFTPQDEPFLQNPVRSAKLGSCLSAVRVGARPHSADCVWRHSRADFTKITGRISLFFLFPFQEQPKYRRNDLLLD